MLPERVVLESPDRVEGDEVMISIRELVMLVVEAKGGQVEGDTGDEIIGAMYSLVDVQLS